MHPSYHTSITPLLNRAQTVLVYQRILIAVAQAQHLCHVFDGVDPLVADTLVDKLCALDTTAVGQDWHEETQKVKHETAGFIQAVRNQLDPPYRPLVYLGLTSSDLIDTATAMQWNTIWFSHLNPAAERLMGALIGWSQEPETRMGRTHGRIAEPVRIGAPYARAARSLLNVQIELNASHYIPGKLSGPVGDGNAVLFPAVWRHAAHSLGIQVDPNPSQIVDRHFYRRVAADLVEITAICEQLATLHRLSAIEGVDLFAEEFEEGVQMGSSVMPHKRNPIKSERICGLARVVRSNYTALLETWNTSWFERDLTNSSVERVAWWDLVQLSHYIVTKTAEVVESGHWRPDIPDDYLSPTDELIRRSLGGEQPDQAYRDIQSRTHQ